MNILITGGSGFIGSSLTQQLLLLGNHVLVLDNFSTGNFNNISRWSKLSNFQFVNTDMRNRDVLQRAVDASDVVFHLAANSSIEQGNRNTKRVFESIEITYNLLDAIKDSTSCRRLLFASTSAVYGEAKMLPIHENYSPLHPISLYAASKLACEAMISGYCRAFNISGVIFRLANIIGPTNRQGVIYDLIMKICKDPTSLEILGNGKQNKSYLHIDDCVNALLQIFNANEKGGADKDSVVIYNIGSKDSITVSDIADIIIKELSAKHVKVRHAGCVDGRGWVGDVRHFLLDCTKIAGLGWEPRYNSREAVTKTVRQYIELLN